MSTKVERMNVESEATPASASACTSTFREIFDAHGRYVWRTLRRLGVRDADANDMCQEVFIVVHRRLAEFDGSSALRSWVYGITVRVASQYRRRAVHRHEELHEEIPQSETAPPQNEKLHERQLLERLDAVLHRLDDDKRAVFVLYELEDLTMTEVASALGCPLQTAYSRLRAAREIVRRAFQDVARERRLG